MSILMQKQTARNLVLSPNSQAAYGGVLADANLNYRASVDASAMFSNPQDRWDDQGTVGHGTDFATADILTAYNTTGTVKGMQGVDAWMLGWMLAFICGQETATGAGPYTHTYTIPNISSLAPCTTAYVEDTNDVHRKYADMPAKTLQIDIPERGLINATLDMVGTGRYIPGSFSTALPAVTPLTQTTALLGSDVGVTITPAGGGAVSFIGRQTGTISIKIERNTAPFKSSGDGYTAGSCQYGKLAFSLDMTIMAKDTDDVNGWFENNTLLNIVVATNPALTTRFGITFPVARVKANKMQNVQDKVAWGLSLDQGTILQNGATPALTPFVVNTCPAYLIPA